MAEQQLSGTLGHREHLRAAAGAAYLASTGGLSDLQTDHRFAQIPIRTLQRWAAEDDWAERRRGLFQKAARMAEEEIAAKLAASMTTEVNDLLALRTAAVQKLQDESVQARSFEAVGKLLVEVHRRLGELRDQQRAAPSAEPKAVPAGTAPTFTAEEAVAAAHAILRVRREHIRAELRLRAAEGPAETDERSAEAEAVGQAEDAHPFSGRSADSGIAAPGHSTRRSTSATR